MTDISLCMIARDEEAMIGACLESVRGAVDEIVVVDTGSRDRTMEIARRHGAKVLERAWDDDFAAPRNAAIKAAKGRWVLSLDADERLAPGSAGALRKLAKKGGFECGLLRLHNANRLDAQAKDVVAGRARLGEPFFLPRLMRRTEDLEFRGIVHESVEEWMRQHGAPRFLDVDIVHLGAIDDVRRARSKRERNIKLLERRVLEHPEDATTYGYLAYEHIEAGDVARAWTIAEAGWAVWLRTPRSARTSVQRLATARAFLQVQQADHEGAHETLATAAAADGEHPDFDFLRGCADEGVALRAPTTLARAEIARRAIASYESALGRKGTYTMRFVNGAAAESAWTRIGCVRLLAGDPAPAQAAFEKALAIAPEHLEAKLGLAECLLERGQEPAALAMLEPLLGERPDGWTLAASAADRLGVLDMHAVFARRAREAAPAGFLSPHRRTRYEEVQLAFAAYAGKPMAGNGPMGTLGALLARAPIREPAPVPAAVAARVAQNLVRAHKLESLGALLEARAEYLAPGIRGAVTAALAELGIDVGDDGVEDPIFIATFGPIEARFIEGILAAHPRLAIVSADGVPPNADSGAWRAALAAPAGKRAVCVSSVVLARLEELSNAFPQARFVHLVRDVRGLLSDAKDDVGERARAWCNAVGHGWTRVERLGARAMELRWEDMLADTRAAVDTTLAFFGEACDPAVLRAFAETYPGRADGWTRNIGERRAIIERASKSALLLYGYEAKS